MKKGVANAQESIQPHHVLKVIGKSSNVVLIRDYQAHSFISSHILK